MKYKVGDKVRVREDLEVDKMYDDIRFADGMKKLRGQIVTITEVHDYNGYYIKEDSRQWFWTDEMFEDLEYTYEDLCNAPVGTMLTFENGNILIKYKKSEGILENEWGSKTDLRDNKDLRNLEDNYGDLGKIIKIEEPQYTTVYKTKDILDKKEKEYLSNVIKPFKDKVMCIIKRDNLTDSGCEYIEFKVRVNQNFSLPNFEIGTMYKGMEVDKEYNLKDLGLG